MEDVLTLVTVLILVAAVIYLSYWVSKNLSKGTVKIGSAKHMSVLDRLILGQDRYLAIVKVLSKYYLVSITGQNVQILKELDEEEISSSEAVFLENKGQGMDSFKNVLHGMLSKKDKDK